ncbi:MAG: GDP-mannose 4,6-dehydratase [Anaerolineae bacterium]|nr:GDP-mannose 4,6-dehydratase [Anaerolineae bacterium]
MAILITGGAGFIGNNLAASLLKRGESVVILDNFDDYYDVAIKRANIAALGDATAVVEGDIRNSALVDRIFQEHKITRVAHLAGLAGVRYSVENGPLYADVNTHGSVVMMDAARRYNVENFIQASTSSVYGQTDRVPFVEEDAPDQPLAPYPASKRSAELYGYSYNNLFGLNFTALRFFNVYGPNGRPDMMPLKVIEALVHDKPITLYDGELRRDWTYIDDLVNGVVAALERPNGYQIINMGYGSPVSLNDFIHTYETLIGKTAIRQSVPTPASEPRILYCNNSRARERLGFDPKVPLEEGLKRTWMWYKSCHNL